MLGSAVRVVVFPDLGKPGQTEYMLHAAGYVLIGPERCNPVEVEKLEVVGTTVTVVVVVWVET